jgi:hypothetical protein
MIVPVWYDHMYGEVLGEVFSGWARLNFFARLFKRFFFNNRGVILVASRDVD